MSFYRDRIKRATGARDEDLPEIEQIMRSIIFHSTLDWQTTAEFDEGAKDAYAVLLDIRNVTTE